MIVPSNNQEILKRDVEAATWLFEQIAIEAREPVDRPKLRRALEEAAEAIDYSTEDRWWRWLVETCRSLGLVSKVIDATYDQVAEMAYDGARVIVRNNQQWLCIPSSKNGKLLVARPFVDRDRVWEKARNLRSDLGLAHKGETIRCVVIEPRISAAGHEATYSKEPFSRLWSLLRPEWSDIWIVIVFALMTGLLALATPLAVETLVNTVAFGRLLQPIIIIALMLLAVLSFSAAIRALQTYVVEIIQRRLFARVAADLAYRLPRVEQNAFGTHDARETVNRFFDVVTVQKVSASLLLDGISLVLTALIGMSVLAFYHPWLLGFDVVLIGLIAFVILVMGRGAIQSSIKESKTKYYMAAWLESIVNCPIAFKYHGAAEYALDRSDQLIYEYLSKRKAHFRILMRQILFALGLQAVASTVLLGLGGWLVISGQLTLGQLVAAELIVTVIVGSFAKLGKHMENYYDVLASVDKLGVLFDLPMERQDGLLNTEIYGPPSVRFHDVSLQPAVAHHDHGDGHHPAAHHHDILSHFFLAIEPGERLGIAGESGSGKSCLFDLIYGLKVPSHGHVVINGLDPRSVRPDVLRRDVVLVRDVEIFSGTIIENVHLERPDVSTSEVRQALNQVGLLDDILKFPLGLETTLIESGAPLTTNQARKLMIARAIVGQPKLVMIDGLLDCLPDRDTQKLLDFLTNPKRDWTLLLISGRQSLLARANRIFYMPDSNHSSHQETHHG